jgi:tetratricopeptide (TPR) repeat protein
VRPWERGRYAAAALLHTEAALGLLARKDASGVSFHLDTASRLFVRGGPDLRSVASRWYVAVVRVLRDRTWVKHAEQLLELGRRRLPADPPMLCESGTLAEWLATDPTLGPSAARQLRINAAGPGRPLSRGAFTDLERRRASDLRRAAGWLTDALEHGSSDAMCRLHLGRVWSLQGEYEHSDPLLLELRDHGDDAVAYLASAFLGASAERRDQLDQAASHYRSAIARFPRGHAAYFGLSGVLQKSGRISEARGVLDDVVDAEENNRREPWWWYFVEPERLADRRLQELRNEVVR